MSVTRPQVLKLYKDLLRGCITYPSKNAPKIYQEIRSEFRIHKNLEGEPLNRALGEANQGLKHLAQYKFSNSSANWSVTSTQTPMPQPTNKGKTSDKSEE